MFSPLNYFSNIFNFLFLFNDLKKTKTFTKSSLLIKTLLDFLVGFVFIKLDVLTPCSIFLKQLKEKQIWFV